MTKTVDLKSLPPGTAFYVPALGRIGRVEYHSAGSSTVSSLEVTIKEVAKKPRKGEQQAEGATPRMVRQRREYWDRTQWAHTTQVVAGPPPKGFKMRGAVDTDTGLTVPDAEEVPAKLGANPFLDDGDDALLYNPFLQD